MPREWEPTWNEKAGVWQTEFWIEGRRLRKRLGIRDRDEKNLARKAAKAFYREAWNCHLTPKPEVSGTPFYLAAKGYVEAGGEARFLGPILKHFGPSVNVEDVDEALVLETALALYPTAKPDTHRRQVRVPITAVCRWQRGERRQPSTDTRRTDWLTPEEAELLISAAKSSFAYGGFAKGDVPEPYTLQKIAFLLGTGCRPGECFAAEMKDWNPATRQWWLPGEATGAGKTAAAARWVRLPQRSVDLIGELPEVGRAFRTSRGKPIPLLRNAGGQMKSSMDKLVKAAGLARHVTPYTLRHTWATWFYSQTKDFGALMDLGGWTSAEMANRYRKIAPDDLADRLTDHGWSFGQDTGKPVRSKPQVIAMKGKK